MRKQQLEYFNKDVPMLKADAAMRILFMILFFVVFVWQLVFLILEQAKGGLTSFKTIISVSSITSSLLFSLIALFYAFKSISIINTINHKGRAKRLITVLANNKKGSFTVVYAAINKLITLVTSLVLISSITYSILELIYYHSISFYIPILCYITLAGLNSVYHISTEFKTLKKVQTYNSIY